MAAPARPNVGAPVRSSISQRAGIGSRVRNASAAARSRAAAGTAKANPARCSAADRDEIANGSRAMSAPLGWGGGLGPGPRRQKSRIDPENVADPFAVERHLRWPVRDETTVGED